MRKESEIQKYICDEWREGVFYHLNQSLFILSVYFSFEIQIQQKLYTISIRNDSTAQI